MYFSIIYEPWIIFARYVAINIFADIARSVRSHGIALGCSINAISTCHVAIKTGM
jgi:hypothetical protein